MTFARVLPCFSGVLCVFALVLSFCTHKAEGYNRTYEGCVSNAYGRIGISINIVTGAIHRVYAGSPAACAGLVAGDKVERVDGRTGMSALSHIDGYAGESVQLTVKHKNGKVEEYTVVREGQSEYEHAQ